MSPDDENVDIVPGVTPYFKTADFPPAAATVQVTCGANSRGGRGHRINEDHYVVIRLGRNQETLLTSLPAESISPRYEEYGHVMVVADGLGGSGSGEGASRLAITTLVSLIGHFGKWHLRVDDAIAGDILARAKRFYRHVDSAVVHESREGQTRVDQTTLTAVFGSGRDLFFAHVGHSRAYLCRNGNLMRLTRDHTLGDPRPTAVPIGPLLDVKAGGEDLRHILTQAIGMGGSIGPTIDLERIRLDDDDRVLVCTNGLSDVVDDERIRDVLRSDQPPGDQCQTLVEIAMAAGGDDDATAVIARYRVPPQVNDTVGDP